jgi:putative peptidoglycan lipid II flippase
MSEENLDKSTRVKRIGFAALILSMGILCSRLLGYVREAVIAWQAGAGSETDAYNAAFMLPDLMNHFLAGGTLSITFIPLFAGYIAKNEPQKAERLFSLIATTMGALLVAAIVLCGIFTTPLAQLLFPGFDAGQIARTVEMTRIILPGQFFHYLGGLMMAVLMARGHFVPSAMAPLIYNLLIIVCGLALGPSMGMKGFAIGA